MVGAAWPLHVHGLVQSQPRSAGVGARIGSVPDLSSRTGDIDRVNSPLCHQCHGGGSAARGGERKYIYIYI